MAPMVDYEQWQQEQALDPAFLASLEQLQPGYQIARLRIRRGLTQAQLAELAGTKQPSIARLENGSSSPSLSFLQKVAQALGAEVHVRLSLKASPHGLHEDSKPDSYQAR